ncbi:MAG: helix-turn-helix domain-containing protein, partial [Rhizomicrobium sp.]
MGNFDLWKLATEYSVAQAALIIAGHRPEIATRYRPSELDEKFHNFTAAKVAICNAIRSKTLAIPRLCEKAKKPLAWDRDSDSTGEMIRGGFLDPESRKDLIELARDGSAAHRLGRRANALVLLDDGLSCEAIAKVLLLDDDTIRTWYRLYREDGIEGLVSFGYEGSACLLNEAQQDQLKAWIGATLPRTTREIGAWIQKAYGIEYLGRSGLVA